MKLGYLAEKSTILFVLVAAFFTTFTTSADAVDTNIFSTFHKSPAQVHDERSSAFDSVIGYARVGLFLQATRGRETGKDGLDSWEVEQARESAAIQAAFGF